MGEKAESLYVLWLAGSGKKFFEVSSSVTLVTIVFQLHHSLIAIQKLRNRMKRKGQGMRDEKGKGEVENITRVRISIATCSRMMAALQR